MVLQGQLIEWVGKSGWGLNSTIFNGHHKSYPNEVSRVK